MGFIGRERDRCKTGLPGKGISFQGKAAARVGYGKTPRPGPGGVPDRDGPKVYRVFPFSPETTLERAITAKAVP